MNAKALTLLDAMRELPPGATIVEIGCVRSPGEVPSDGYSTVYLGSEAAKRGWIIHSVDNDIKAVAVSRKLVFYLPVRVHHRNGLRFLRDYVGRIDGLYLDGALDPADTLAQYRAARTDWLRRVVVDDAQIVEDVGHGKADLVLDVLRADGFKVAIKPTEPGYLMAVAKR